MIGAIIGYAVARPFVKKAAKKRREYKAEMTRDKANARIARERARRAPDVTFTPDELDYLHAHAAHPYK